MASERYYGTGRRKTSVARVYLVPGTGKITINKRDIEDYLGLEVLRMTVRQPLVATETNEKFDVCVNVLGGGMAGQGSRHRGGAYRRPKRARPQSRSGGASRHHCECYRSPGVSTQQADAAAFAAWPEPLRHPSVLLIR